MPTRFSVLLGKLKLKFIWKNKQARIVRKIQKKKNHEVVVGGGTKPSPDTKTCQRKLANSYFVYRLEKSF